MTDSSRISNGLSKDHPNGVRPVEEGDTLAELTPVAAEQDAVDRGAKRAQVGKELTLRDLLSRYSNREQGGEVLADLRSLLD